MSGLRSSIEYLSGGASSSPSRLRSAEAVSDAPPKKMVAASSGSQPRGQMDSSASIARAACSIGASFESRDAAGGSCPANGDDDSVDRWS